MIASSLFGILALLAGRAAADPFFIVQHGKPVVVSRLDPIVSPNGISSHVHSVVGGSAFSSVYTYEASRASKCTTANVFEDDSNYWVPTLYRKGGNGTFTLAPLEYVNTYYLMRRSGPDEKVLPFPPGFKMMAGSSKRTTYDPEDYTNQAISYVCLGVDGSPETPAFPEQSCPNGLRAQAFYPNCWNGKDLWLEGSAHVAYPVSGGYNSGGPCPATHPHRVMSLFFEFIFKDDYEYTPGARVWSTGDTEGYTLHGDFTNGWPEGLFEEVFEAGDTCNVEFSIENCPPLDKVFTGKGGGTCQPDDASVLIDEEIGLNGPLTQLPGNPTLGGAPAASSAAATTAATVIATTETSPLASETPVTSPDNATIATAIPVGDASTTIAPEAGATTSTGTGRDESASALPTAEASISKGDPGLNLVADPTSSGAASADPTATATATGGHGHKVCHAKRRLGLQY